MATSCTTRRRAAASTAASTFLLLVLTPRAAAQESTKYGDFGASAIVITLIGAFFIITAFLSIFLRQLAERCFGTADHQHHLTAARGLDEAAIKSLPTFLYSDVKEHRLGKGDLECAVCLNEFEDHEVLRILPGCSHVFHPHCINPWLRSHATCPVCRRNLNPTTQNEPMVRVVMDGCDGVEDCEESRGESSAAVGSSVDDRRFIGKFPRSHSTGHSMSRHLEDWDRFTLRLPEDLIDSRLHQSGGCGSEHENNVDRWGWLSMTPPFKGPSKLNPSPTNLRSNRMWSPKNLMLRSNKSPVNQATSKDPGEQSSDRLFVQPFV